MDPDFFVGSRSKLQKLISDGGYWITMSGTISGGQGPDPEVEDRMHICQGSDPCLGVGSGRRESDPDIGYRIRMWGARSRQGGPDPDIGGTESNTKWIRCGSWFSKIIMVF
jgi:hypothetical protein